MSAGREAGLRALTDVELETIARAVRLGLTPSPLTRSALAELSVGDRAGWLVGLDTEAVLAAIIAILASALDCTGTLRSYVVTPAGTPA